MKRIALISFSCISMISAQPCFQPVDSMNLWQMSKEIGECVNAYGESTIELLDSTIDLLDSSIDLLDIILCSVGSVVRIMQSDLTSPYVITQQNYYKICENITASTTITISSNNVVLDLDHIFSMVYLLW